MPIVMLELTRAFRAQLAPAARQLWLLGFTLLLFGGAHLARLGTLPARAAYWGALLAVLVSAVMVAWWSARRWASPGEALRRVLTPLDRRLAASALRAFGLVKQTEADPSLGSPALARVHFERLLAQASVTAVKEVAGRRARRLHFSSIGCAVAIVALLVGAPMALIEGLDVACAVGARAPLPLVWLADAELQAAPPSYLVFARVGGTGQHLSGAEELALGARAELPEGSTVTVVGQPVRTGRQLVLTDGVREVPFVADGAGRVKASLVVDRSANVFIAARFGDVLVPEPSGVEIAAIPDRAPTVELDGAPKTLELKDVTQLELAYVASDDHGVKQVDLVISHGKQETRRVLGRFDGDRPVERGAYGLGARDSALRRAFLPVEVSIEARDNDSRKGAKWGRSAIITLLPPPVGQAEAERARALRSLRDSVVERLAELLTGPSKLDAVQKERAGKLAEELTGKLDASFGGLTFSRGLKSFVKGQLRVLREQTSGPRAARAALEVALALDSAALALGGRDAAPVARVLAAVAEEIQAAAGKAQSETDATAAKRRVEHARNVLGVGARNLVELGALGADLGTLTLGALTRIDRARADKDWFHVELAAKHLAERLRRPAPSFSSSGGGAEGDGPADGEGTGSAHGGAKPGEGASGADKAFDALMEELARLAADHRADLESTERTLDEAAKQGAAKDEALVAEAKRRAAELERAIQELPSFGDDLAQRAAAQGKERARALAQQLAQLDFEGAAEAGKEARSRLELAERLDAEDDLLDGKTLRSARDAVEAARAWADSQRERARELAKDAARDALERLSKRETQHAERAKDLGKRGRESESSLPDDALERLEKAQELMQDAAKELAAGKGDAALELAREAQHLLEGAESGRSSEGEDDTPDEPNPKQGPRNAKGLSSEGEVPEQTKDGDAQDFRKRVLDGLGRGGGGRLGPAVKRYAEQLLR